MKDYGKWYSINEPPKEEGVYLVANRQGLIALKIYNPMLFYPFADDPNSCDFIDITCWAYTPELSEEFTDINVINELKGGIARQVITDNNVKN